MNKRPTRPASGLRSAPAWLLVVIGAVTGSVFGIGSFLLLNRPTRSARLPPGNAPLALAAVSAPPAQPAALTARPNPPIWAPFGTIGRHFVAGTPWLARLAHSRLLMRYRWAVLPIVVVGAVGVNSHLYYNTFYGFDMPQHFMNLYSLFNTGLMPQPPITGETYEASQSPLFYVLATWVAKIGNLFVQDPYPAMIPPLLFALSLGWLVATIYFVQRVLPRTSGFVRGLVVCVVMLFPATVEVGTMFNNDLAANLMLTLSVIVCWQMVRSGHHHERRWWLRLAALSGLAIAFKATGDMLMVLYSGLALYLAAIDLHERQRRRAINLLATAALGVPLLLLPFVVTAWHVSHYSVDPLGFAQDPPRNAPWEYWKLRYITTFDATLFTKPYAFGPGTASFWSLQYVQLHNDYYNHWYSKAFDALPPSQKVNLNNQQPIPQGRFDTAILLQYVAIPITLVLVAGGLAALWLTLRRPRRAVRTGQVVVALSAIMLQVTYVVQLARYPNILVMQVRYANFVYMLLFILGVGWLRRRTAHQTNIRWVVRMGLTVCMAAYAFVAAELMWLPPI